MDDIVRNAVIITVLFCVVPAGLTAAVLFFAFRRLTVYAVPDTSKMEQQFQKMRVTHPSLSQEALLRRVVQREAFKCGVVGAVTSVGGFITLPVTLPVDIFVSLQIQKSMVEFIAASYGKTQVGDVEARIRSYLIISGGIQATETSTRLFMRFFTRILEKSFSKLIPFLGAFIGFLVNYWIAQATGRLAIEWYSGRLSLDGKRLDRPPALKQ